MLQKPNLPDSLLISHLQSAYDLDIRAISFLPLGADINTAVYRVDTQARIAYFMKLRIGEVNTHSVEVPYFLYQQGIPAIISPLKTHTGQLYANLTPYRIILYPFIEGQNAYAVPLSDQQWLEFGAALKAIHTCPLSPTLRQNIPIETYSPHWRDEVKTFQSQISQSKYTDLIAKKTAAVMHAYREVITRLVTRAEQLAAHLRTEPLEMVLCHSDIHAGNLLLTPGGELFIIDWDTPIIAPKERDLMLIGGCFTWHDPRQTDLFNQGYGSAPMHPSALAYYRCERIIWDIAAYCEQLLEATTGGEDCEQSLTYFASNFLPDHEIEIAMNM